MTNDYDAHAPRDLDRAQERPQYHTDPPYQPPRSMAEAVDIRSRLATNLRASVEEAHNLATFYSNFAQTLELCLSQLETKK